MAAAGRGFDPEATKYTGDCWHVQLYTSSEEEDFIDGSHLGPHFLTQDECWSFFDGLSHQQIKAEAPYFGEGVTELRWEVEECHYTDGAFDYGNSCDNGGWPVSWRAGKPVIQWSRGY